MKNLTQILAIITIIAFGQTAYSQSNSSSALQGLFNKLSGSSSQTTNSDENNNQNKGTDLSSILGAIGGVVENLITTDNLEVSDLTGTWQYESPAVAFKSDDLLKKAGGAAAASQLESKLANYYKYLRIQSMQIVINPDATFSMTFNKIALTGDISKDEEGNFYFNYKVGNQINIGSLRTYITKSSNKLNVMYDISKLIVILEKAGSFLGNSTINSITSLLNGFDGVTAGFKLVKVQ